MIITKSQIDFSEISNTCEAPTKLPFERYKDKFRKIAFDVYAPINDPTDNLWTLQNTDDGDFLIRTHWDHENAHLKESQEIGWNATPNKEGSAVTLYYKDLPLINLTAAEYGFDKSDTRGFIKTLLHFMRDKNNVATLLKSLPEKKAALLLNNEDFANIKVAALTPQMSGQAADVYVQRLLREVPNLVGIIAAKYGYDLGGVDALLKEYYDDISNALRENKNATAYEIFSFIKDLYKEKAERAKGTDVGIIYATIYKATDIIMFREGPEDEPDASPQQTGEAPQDAPQERSIPMDIQKVLETAERQSTTQYKNDPEKMQIATGLLTGIIGPTIRETYQFYPNAENEDVIARVVAILELLKEHGDYNAEQEAVLGIMLSTFKGALTKFKSENALSQNPNQYKYMDALNKAFLQIAKDNFYEAQGDSPEKAEKHMKESGAFLAALVEDLRNRAASIPHMTEEQFKRFLLNSVNELHETRMEARFSGDKRRFFTRFMTELAKVLNEEEGKGEALESDESYDDELPSGEDISAEEAVKQIFGENAEAAKERLGNEMAILIAKIMYNIVIDTTPDNKNIISMFDSLVGMAQDLAREGLDFEQAAKRIRDVMGMIVATSQKPDDIKHKMLESLISTIDKELKE